jgi:site-specific recombinase XerD
MDRSFINADITLVPDSTGRKITLPGLVSDGGVVMPLVWYAEAKWQKYSLSTLRKIREAMRLFLEYSTANVPTAGFGVDGLHGESNWQHFERFRGALVNGTFDTKTGLDSSGLGWRASSIGKANQVIRYLTDFFVWADSHGAKGAQRFNPETAPSRYEDLMQRAAYEYRRSKAFLGHTWETSQGIQTNTRVVARAKEPRKRSKQPVRFPENSFTRLLKEGFTVRSPSNLRDILITVLLNKSGLRESEPMHLYISDVTYDPVTGGARVVIPHPSQGKAPTGVNGAHYKNRQDYLAMRYNLLPRNVVAGPLHAGWKSVFDQVEAIWFEPEWGRIFWALWQRYLVYVAPIRRRHPFAFITLDGPTKGEPLKLDAFNKSHRSAVYRAGLVPLSGDVDLKAAGLTPHGHRHGYAHRAKNLAGLDPVVVQRMLNHASPESQDAYTGLSRSEIQSLLEDANKRMHGTSVIDDGILDELRAPSPV